MLDDEELCDGVDDVDDLVVEGEECNKFDAAAVVAEEGEDKRDAENGKSKPSCDEHASEHPGIHDLGRGQSLALEHAGR